MVSKKVELQMEHILDNFTFHGASSAGIMLFKSGKLSFFKSTCSKWHDFYNTAPEKNKCHLVQKSMEISHQLISNPNSMKSFSLIWDLQMPHNEESLYLNEQRDKYNHSHGISIIDLPQSDILIGLTLTGRRCDTNFIKDVIENKANISKDFEVLKMLIKKY